MEKQKHPNTIALINYYHAHPDASCCQLGRLFGISPQAAWKHIDRENREQAMIEYYRTNPGASPDEVRARFHVSRQRAISLMFAGQQPVEEPVLSPR
jgi:hypothetical protein